ncbi:hypothetical protein [Caballeronia sp. AZ7_KS35]|uniref:hypothetical protein n=1 Tax=Caballeronia sp. AZ7_KS35 TaxID=2921762 RepID=UPI0020278125|nr:hypothetical protein [Caballeronia sp. AZ7_KS35]
MAQDLGLPWADDVLAYQKTFLQIFSHCALDSEFSASGTDSEREHERGAHRQGK